MNAPKSRTTFRKDKVIAPLHTSGPFTVTSDGKRLLTCVNDQVVLTDVESAVEICRFKGDSSTISALAVTPSDTHLIIAYSSLTLRIYELPSDNSTTLIPWIRQIPRATDAPITVLSTDPTSTYISCGSASSQIKVYDIHRGFPTHSYSPSGAGVISCLAFHFVAGHTFLIVGSVDTKIRMYDLAQTSRSEPIAVLEGHVSVPRAVSVSKDNKYLITTGRDAVFLIWDLSPTSTASKLGKKQKLELDLLGTIPVLERVEAGGVVELEGESGLKVFTAGEKGIVKVWDVKSGKVVRTLAGHRISEDADESGQIVQAMYIPSKAQIVTLHADQNILFHNLSDYKLARQLIGYNDEIVDATFLSPSPTSPDTHLALGTNSPLIRIYDTRTMDARLLAGHSDVVLCLDHSADGRVLVSAGKDRSARIWVPTDEGDWRVQGLAEGHTESVGAIGLSRRPNEKLQFMVTGSQDRTIKLWDVSPLSSSSSETTMRVRSLSTLVAHDKDINALDVSPNDRFVVTASQDKTAKIFGIEYTLKSGGGARGDLKPIATLKGHKRGVWTARFSQFDRVVVTGSGDKSVKLWSLENYACLKTFEGHTNSVLRVDFLNKGTQLVTAGADGLVKVWDVKDEECITNLDNHEEKIWSLAIPTDEHCIVSAGADSVVTFWEDATELEEEEKLAAKAELVLKDQDFINYLSIQDYRNAVLLALSMDQPARLFNLFQSIRKPGTDSITGNAAVDTVIQTLPPLELARLLRHVRNWNANNRTYVVAQTILHAILKLHAVQDILDAFNTGEPLVLAEMNGDTDDKPPAKDKDLRALRDLLDGLIPYTERHFNRAERLVQESYVLDFILSEMDSGVVPEEMDFAVTKQTVYPRVGEDGPASKKMADDMAAMDIEDHEWGGL